MGVTLKPELMKLIESDIAAGRADDLEDFLDKAIHNYILARDLEATYSVSEVQAKIERGLSQIERGEGIPMDEAFRQIRARAAEYRKKSV